MPNNRKNLTKYHWTIKGGIIATFVAAFSFLNFIFSINFNTYALNYNWLVAFFFSLLIFVICSVWYVISLDDE